jgi:eukaryotic-like serine/threonine-protein kinase
VAERLPQVAGGDLVSGRYRVERPLGSGATAAVWAARDVELGRPVALKLLTAGVDEELAARFEREGVILNQLRHPNVVPVLASGTDQGRRYLVMELVDGTALDELLRDGPLPVEDAVGIAADLAAGLGAAHRAGVVHRDVKPANVVCDRQGVPRLVDFGIARAAGLASVTSVGTVLGTAAYLSPEQAGGEVPGPETDVYALGCLLHELVTGHPPFSGDSAVAVAQRHMTDAPEPIRSSVPDAPEALERIVLRCLEKRPSDRYPTAAELEEDLRLVQAGDTPAWLLPADATAALPSDPPAANETVVLTAAARPDQTLVIPAAALDPAGVPPTGEAVAETIDPSPLVTPPADDRASRPLRPAVIAAAAAVLAVLGVLGLAALASDDGDAAPASRTSEAPPVTEAVAEVEQAPAPAPPPADAGGDAGGQGEGQGKGKGKAKGEKKN